MKKLLSLIMCMFLTLNFTSCKNIKNKQSNKLSASNTGHMYIKLVNMNIKTDKMNINYPKVQGLKDNYVSSKVNDAIQEIAFTVEKMNDIDPEDLNKTNVTVDYENPFLNNSILSIKFRSSFYFEGISNPSNYSTSITVNLDSGKIYYLDDIFKPESNYIPKLNTIINKQIKDKNIELLKPFKGIDGEQKFYLNQKGLVIYYQEQEYTSHSYGQLEFTIPYSEVKSMLKIWIN